jgi:hypothetical protein
MFAWNAAYDESDVVSYKFESSVSLAYDYSQANHLS